MNRPKGRTEGRVQRLDVPRLAPGTALEGGPSKLDSLGRDGDWLLLAGSCIESHGLSRRSPRFNGLVLAVHRLDEGFIVVHVCLKELHEGGDRTVDVCDDIRIGS